MINGKSVLAVITARGGSKGLPRKNLLNLLDRPLVAWSIDAAQQSTYVDRLILSSEDAEIIETSRAYGCEVPFVRPACLAADDATTMAVLAHVMDELPEQYDYLILLQPTSPLRLSGDIDGALERCEEAGAPACISITVARQSPYKTYLIDEAQRLRPAMGAKSGSSRRQELPVAYAANGAVYVARCDWLREHSDFLGPATVGYLMPGSRSVDIDEEDDLRLAEFWLQQRRMSGP